MNLLIKKILKGSLAKVHTKKLEKELTTRDKKYCLSHPEWADLTAEEKRAVDKRDLYGIKIFKNIYGFAEGFVTDTFYQCAMLPKLNSVNYNFISQCDIRGYYEDKNYQDFFMSGIVKTPKSVIRCVNGILFDSMFNAVSKEQALEIMNNYDALVFKTSVQACHGRGVRKVERKDYENEIEYRSGGGTQSNYVVQEIIKQHPFLAHYNSSSVNVIRITTLNLDGNVMALSGVLRIGPPGSFCDLLPSDGIHPRIIGLNDDGTLKHVAVDPDMFEKHDTVFGKIIEGRVPKYDEMRETVLKAHAKFPKCGILGWDLTLDEKENIIFIEYNAECPGIIQTQLLNGPVFANVKYCGKPLLEVLQEV